MRRVLAMLGSDLRLVSRSETARGVLSSEDGDAWLARLRKVLADVDTRSIAAMLDEDDLSPSGLRHDRAQLLRIVADRLARGGWRLATGAETERHYVLPLGDVEEEDEGELEGDYEVLTVSFYADAEPRFVDAEIEGELEPEHFEVELEGELEPQIIEPEIEAEFVPAGVRGWVLGGVLEELPEDPQAETLRLAAQHGTPFCEECARLAAAQAAGEA